MLITVVVVWLLNIALLCVILFLPMRKYFSANKELYREYLKSSVAGLYAGAVILFADQVFFSGHQFSIVRLLEFVAGFIVVVLIGAHVYISISKLGKNE